MPALSHCKNDATQLQGLPSGTSRQSESTQMRNEDASWGSASPYRVRGALGEWGGGGRGRTCRKEPPLESGC